MRGWCLSVLILGVSVRFLVLQSTYRFKSNISDCVESQIICKTTGSSLGVKSNGSLRGGANSTKSLQQASLEETTTSATRHRQLQDEDRVLELQEASVGISSLTLSGDFTISAWVYLNPGISNSDQIVGSADQNINFHNSLVRLFIGFGKGHDFIIAKTPAKAVTWTHYSFVRSGGTTTIYIDGAVDAEKSGWTGDFALDTIGGGIKVPPFDGRLDDLNTWSVARTATEIQNEMERNLGNTAGLVRRYSFDGNGNQVVDDTGNSASVPLPDGAGFRPRNDIPLPPSVGPTLALKLKSERVAFDPLQLEGDFTMSGWFYFTPSSTISSKDGFFAGTNLAASFADSLLRITIAGEPDLLIANTPVVTGEWTHISITRESGVVRFYLNGNLDVSTTSRVRFNLQGAPFNDDIAVLDLFGGTPGGSTGMEGQVDDVQIWAVARSQEDIQSDLTGELSDTGGLLRRYSFGFGQTSIVDETGNTAPLPLPQNSELVDSTAPFLVPVRANQFSDAQVATGFVLPVDIGFLPDGRMLVLEKAGTVKIVADPTVIGSDVATYLDLTSVTDNFRERGLLAVEVDPDFSKNNFLYFYHTLIESGTPKTTASRYVHVENGGGSSSRADPSSATILFQELDQAVSGTHIGGGLSIAYEPIGTNDPSPYKLYIVTSDDSQPANSADLTSDDGKVHRINLTDGSIPVDNPYYDADVAALYTPSVDTSSAVSRSPINLSLDPQGVITTIHSRGVRNGWRSTYDQQSNTLLFGEVGSGQTSFEDVHVAVRGHWRTRQTLATRFIATNAILIFQTEPILVLLSREVLFIVGRISPLSFKVHISTETGRRIGCVN